MRQEKRGKGIDDAKQNRRGEKQFNSNNVRIRLRMNESNRIVRDEGKKNTSTTSGTITLCRDEGDVQDGSRFGNFQTLIISSLLLPTAFYLA